MSNIACHLVLVYRKTQNHSQFTNSLILTVNAFLSAFQSNTTYYIRVAAENEEGVGEWRELSEPIRPMRPASLPTAPANVSVDCLTRDSVTLRWERPSDTGGVPLSGYIIEQVRGNFLANWNFVVKVNFTVKGK